MQLNSVTVNETEWWEKLWLLSVPCYEKKGLVKCLEGPFSLMHTKQGTGIIRHFLTKKGSKENKNWGLQKVVVGRNKGVVVLTGFLD